MKLQGLVAGGSVSRILQPSKIEPFDSATYRKQRTSAVTDVHCVADARIAGTPQPHSARFTPLPVPETLSRASLQVVEFTRYGEPDSGARKSPDFGATGCCVEGTLVRLRSGKTLPIEHLAIGQELRGVDGEPVRLLFKPERTDQMCFAIRTLNGFELQASGSHTLIRGRGGYVRVEESLGQVVKTVRGNSRVILKQGLATLPVYGLSVNGSHSYEVNGIWSLE